MKHILKVLLSAMVILSLLLIGSACGHSAENTDMDEPVTQTDDDVNEEGSADQEDAGSGMLVIYFSRTGEQYNVGVIDEGNTAIVAGMIAEETGADTFEVLPAEDNYPMTYDELTEVAKEEQTQRARPAYKGELPDLSQYRTIFIGAPVWWGDWPMIMYTVFESNDFAGKTLVPFSTHEGSGLANFESALSSACPESEILKGLAIRGNDAQNDRDSVRQNVKEWLADQL